VDRAAEPNRGRPLAPMIPATLALVEIPIDFHTAHLAGTVARHRPQPEAAFCVLRGQDPVRGRQPALGAGVGVYLRGHPAGRGVRHLPQRTLLYPAATGDERLVVLIARSRALAIPLYRPRARG
jgi:hypothetical protein